MTNIDDAIEARGANAGRLGFCALTSIAFRVDVARTIQATTHRGIWARLACCRSLSAVGFQYEVLDESLHGG